MNRTEFFENKVLSDAEYGVIAGYFEETEDMLQDVLINLREAITGVMTKLYEKKHSTEFVCDRFTLINRFGDIGVIDKEVDDEDETSLDDVNSVDMLMDIFSNFI